MSEWQSLFHVDARIEWNFFQKNCFRHINDLGYFQAKGLDEDWRLPEPWGEANLTDLLNDIYYPYEDLIHVKANVIKPTLPNITCTGK